MFSNQLQPCAVRCGTQRCFPWMVCKMSGSNELQYFWSLFEVSVSAVFFQDKIQYSDVNETRHLLMFLACLNPGEPFPKNSPETKALLLVDTSTAQYPDYCHDPSCKSKGNILGKSI